MASTGDLQVDGNKASSSASSKKPKKSILKHTPNDHTHDDHKGASFDEMNILATYHPPGKDYGHMKIDEPKTPYRCDNEDVDDLDPEDVSQRLSNVNELNAERKRYDSGSAKSDNDFEEEDRMSPEERERHKKFEEHRKEHYNMKAQIQRAKELLAKEMAELEDE